MAPSLPVGNPDAVENRQDLARELTALRQNAGLSIRSLASRLGIPAGTLGGYLSGRHLPQPTQLPVFVDLLKACGVADEDQVQRWLAALQRVRASSDRRGQRVTNPYRGLEPYGEDDAEWFFGRRAALTQLIDRIQAALAGPRLVVLVGASGSGKSSLLRAGLVAAVRRGELAAADAAVVMTPGDRPVASLQAAMPDAPRGLLIVDQLEEIFTSATPTEGLEFLALLDRTRRAGLCVVLGLRADFYAEAAEQPLLLAALRDWQVLLGPMTETDLREAITQPARQAGAMIEDTLVDVLLAEVAPRTGSAADAVGALPLLSHALFATWQAAKRTELTVADYRATGGIDGAVQKSAEDTFVSLGPADQDLAQRIFLRLVNVDGAVPTRRRVRREELRAIGGADTDDVLNRFVDARLLTAGSETVEVSHEALLGAWPRLRGWLEDSSVSVQLHRRITVAAQEWVDTDRDPGALLRGGRLAAATEWAADAAHEAALNAVEQAYLEASREAARKEEREARRRSRRLAQLLAVVAVMALLAVGLAGYALTARSAAAQARDDALSRELALQVQQLRQDNPSLAAQLAVAAYRISATPQARSALLDSTALPLPRRLVGPSGAMQAVAVSPDGKHLAATGADGRVHLWNLAANGSTSQQQLLGAPDPGRTLFAVAFSPDGHLLAAAGSDRVVQLWQLGASPRAISPLGGAANTIYSVAFNRAGTQLAAGSADGAVHRWALDGTGHATPLSTLRGATGYVQSVTFTPSGSDVIAGTASGTVLRWHLPSSNSPVVLYRVPKPTDAIFAVAVSPDGSQLLAGTQGGDAVNIPLRPHTGKPSTAVHFGNWVNSVAFSSDGSLAAAGSSDATAQVWNVRTGATVQTLHHSAAVTAVAFLPDSTHLATTSNDGIARIWPVSGPVLHSDPGSIFATGQSRGGNLLMTADANGTVRLWQHGRLVSAAIHSAKPAAPFDGAAAISGDGRLVAAGGSTGSAELWDTSNPSAPRRLTQLPGATATVESLAFSPNDHLLALASDDGHTYLWDVSTPTHPRRLAVLGGFTNYVFGVAFSPDGHLLAAASADRTARLFDIAEPAAPHLLAVVQGFKNYVYAAAFGPDHVLALAGADKTVRLFDISNPRRPVLIGAPLTGPTNFLISAAFSPDGHLLAAVGNDGLGWIWDVHDTRHPTLYVALHAAADGSLFAVTFGPQSAMIASGSGGATYQWLTDTGDAQHLVCAQAGDPISRTEWAEYVPGATYDPPCK